MKRITKQKAFELYRFEYTIFEIYTVNPDNPKMTGWDIDFVIVPGVVKSARELIKHYPLFDCIISTNDSNMNNDYLYPHFTKE